MFVIRFKAIFILALTMVVCSCASASTVVAIAGGDYPMALRSDGTVYAWSLNYMFGETSTYTPVQLAGVTDITAIATGGVDWAVLKGDGTVWDWGVDYWGQLGDGTETNSDTPVQASGLTDVKAVSAGWAHTLALKSDGTVWAWGWNVYGQLGDGTTTDQCTPEQVPGVTGVTAIAAGYYDTEILKSDGTVWGWGFNGSYNLGNGTYQNFTTTPVQASGLTNVVAIAAGPFHTAALKSDGTVWEWGDNSYGELGTGIGYSSNVPVQVPGLTGVTAIAAGGFSTVALKCDGTVWQWGREEIGVTGDNVAYATYTTPVQVPGLTGITALSDEGIYAMALKNDGTVWAWGDNLDGELGDNGQEECSPTPVHVEFPPDMNVQINPTSAPVGSTVQLTATLENWSGQALTGETINFSGLPGYATSAYAQTDSNGAATISYKIEGGAGPYSITAAFPGDGYYGPISQSSALTVSKADTQITCPGVTGGLDGTVDLSGTLRRVTDNSAVTYRSLTFTVDGVVVGTAETDGTGTAVLPYQILVGFATGNHTLAASFSGDVWYNPSTCLSSTLTVTQPTGPNLLGIPDTEFQALIALYNGTNGPSWTNHANWWVASSDWYGLTVINGHVVDIYLNGNNLNGTLPTELGNLTQLEGLGLADNQLSGTIPSQIGSLTNLQQLYLSDNQLNGTIPSQIGNLTTAWDVELNNNQLTGSIPPELGNLTNLIWLYLSNNQLSGAIPAQLGNLTNVGDLELNNNQLSGSIPSELGNLSNLTILDVSANQLVGQIPSSIVGLASLGGPGSDGSFGYNGLSSTDPTVLAFMAAEYPGWQDTQTVPPTEVTAMRSDIGSANVSWTPIAYTGDGGYYQIGVSQTSGGPYTFNPQNRTASKSDSTITVTGLAPGVNYIVVETVTPANPNNQNTVTSLASAEVQVAAQPTTALDKSGSDGTPVAMQGAVTAAFGGFFYVENPDRTRGIRVVWSGAAPGAGLADVYGALSTNSAGERYINASSVTAAGSGSVLPLGVTNAALGGGDFFWDASTGAGQCGVWGQQGLNNVGLLVKTWGKVTAAGTGWFYIDDGSNVSDGSENTGVYVDAQGQSVPAVDDYVCVTGISSCRMCSGNVVNALLATNICVSVVVN